MNVLCIVDVSINKYVVKTYLGVILPIDLLDLLLDSFSLVETQHLNGVTNYEKGI